MSMSGSMWIQTVDGDLLNVAHVRRIHVEPRGSEYVVAADVPGAGVGGYIIDHHRSAEAARQALAEIAELVGARRPVLLPPSADAISRESPAEVEASPPASG
ncbi:MAG: hypothetical protein ACRDQW_05720 [Haloechinothrix sp.]